MLAVRVEWMGDSPHETWYETPYVSWFDDPKDTGGRRIAIMPTVDGGPQMIYMCDVRSVGVWQGGKEIRYYCHISKPAV